MEEYKEEQLEVNELDEQIEDEELDEQVDDEVDEELYEEKESFIKRIFRVHLKKCFKIATHKLRRAIMRSRN